MIGIIGRSGIFYPCKHTQHTQTILDNISDGPFVEIKSNGFVEFEAYYTEEKITPNKAQFETLMDWCTRYNKKFENVIDCWSDPWEIWR